MKKIFWGFVFLSFIFAGCDESVEKKTIIYPDGSKYVGKLKNGIPNGNGIFTDFDGEVCVGEWNGHKNGKLVTCEWPTGHKSEGQKYIGSVKDVKANGFGTHEWPNGAKYVGEWVDFKRTGKGTMYYSNGNKYIGDWVNSQRNGQGIHILSNGNKYVGEFRDDKRHGSGVQSFADEKEFNGKSFFVEYDDGKLVSVQLASHLAISIDGYISDNSSSYNSKKKPRLYYDRAGGGMRECSYDAGAFGNCVSFKSYDKNAYSNDTLFYNKKTNNHQPCIGAVTALGQCTAFGLYKPGSVSKDQLFYNPKNNKMTTCSSVSVTGKCLFYDLVAKPSSNSGFSSQSQVNPYYFQVPQTSEQLIDHGLNMLGGGCRIGRNC